MADEIRDAITTNAQGPKRVTIDGQSAEAHDIAQQIQADQYLAAKAAAAKNHFGLRFAKLEPPGAG